MTFLTKISGACVLLTLMTNGEEDFILPEDQLQWKIRTPPKLELTHDRYIALKKLATVICDDEHTISHLNYLFEETTKAKIYNTAVYNVMLHYPDRRPSLDKLRTAHEQLVEYMQGEMTQFHLFDDFEEADFELKQTMNFWTFARQVVFGEKRSWEDYVLFRGAYFRMEKTDWPQVSLSEENFEKFADVNSEEHQSSKWRFQLHSCTVLNDREDSNESSDIEFVRRGEEEETYSETTRLDALPTYAAGSNLLQIVIMVCAILKTIFTHIIRGSSQLLFGHEE